MSVSDNQQFFLDLRSRAQSLDVEHRTRATRDEFRIPTKADVKRKTLPRNGKLTCLNANAHIHIDPLLMSSRPFLR